MNEVIEVGLQLVAERNSREKECKEVEAAVSLAHEEYKEQLAALAEAVAMESAAILRQSAAQSTSCISTQSQRDVPRPQTSRGKLTGKAMGSSQSQPPSSPVAHSTPLGTNDAGLRRRKREQRAQGESQKSGLHKDSVSQLQHNVTNKSWGSSSPATILPRHSQPQSDGDEAAEEGDLPLPSTQPHRIRHSLPDKQEELRNQKQNQDRRRNTTGGMKSKRMPVGSADTIAERSVASTTSESIAQMRRKSRLPTSLRIADTQQGHTGRSDLTTSSVTGPFAGNRGRREDESSSDDSIESKETSRKQQMKRHGRGRQM